MAISIRAAAPADYPAFARLMPELGTPETPPPRERWVAELCPDSLIAERDGTIVGYLYLETLKALGYVRHVVVAPQARGSGVGRALMEAAAGNLHQAGIAEWCLNVKPDNAPAIALYERMGLRRAFRCLALRFPWSLVDALPFGPPDVAGRIVAPAEDLLVEPALGLPAGQLASRRNRAAWVQMGLWRSAMPVGVASFDPAFPGAFPFRVTDPELAGPLLRALRPHALPNAPHMGIVAEGDAGLEALLLDHGAAAAMEVLRFVGRLPPPQDSVDASSRAP